MLQERRWLLKQEGNTVEDTESSISAQILASIVEGFPVTESPYCDMGIEIGASEVAVLDAVVGMREEGVITRIGADFVDLDAFLGEASADDADLAQAASVDLPWSEHPYEELAALLQMRGVDRDAEWVMARLKAWLGDGTIKRIGVDGPA